MAETPDLFLRPAAYFCESRLKSPGTAGNRRPVISKSPILIGNRQDIGRNVQKINSNSQRIGSNRIRINKCK